MVFLGWLLAIAVAIVAVVLAVILLNRFYRKSTRDVALVQYVQDEIRRLTGAGESLST